MTISTKEISYDGAVTFYSLSELLPHDKIKASLKEIGLEKYAPRAMSGYTRLKAALDDLIADPDIMIRHMAVQAGWNVVRETRVKGPNEYHNVASIFVDEPTQKLTFEGGAPSFHTEVSNNFERLNGYVSTTQLSYSLVNIIDHLLGTPLRSHGSIYWLPAVSLDKWASVSEAIAGANGGNLIYLIRHSYDADSVTAVQTAIARNLLSEVESIYQEICSGDKNTDRQVENRGKRIWALKEKIRAVSQASGIPVHAVEQAVDKLECAEAASVLTD